MSVPSAEVIWATGLGASPSQAFVRSVDGGQSWNNGLIPTPSTSWENGSIFALDSLIAWVTFFNDATGTLGAVYKTSDGGVTWARQGESSLFLDASTSFANWTYFWDENEGITMGDPTLGFFEIWRSTNGGDSWTRVPQGNIPAPISGEYGLTDGYAVVGDTVWFVTNKGTALRSTNRGQNWQAYPTGHTGYYKIYFRDAQNGLSVRTTGTSASTFRSSADGGATWSAAFTATVTDSTLGIIDVPFQMRHADYVPGTGILVGVGRETNFLYEIAAVSYDGGHTFTSLGLAPGDFSYVQMVSASMGYLGGSESSVARIYRLDTGISGVKEPLAATAPVRILGNPVSDQLVIEVLEDLGAEGAVALMDMGGQQLHRVEAPYTFAGQQVQLPLSSFPAGVYLLKISSDKGAFTLKVLVE